MIFLYSWAATSGSSPKVGPPRWHRPAPLSTTSALPLTTDPLPDLPPILFSTITITAATAVPPMGSCSRTSSADLLSMQNHALAVAVVVEAGVLLPYPRPHSITIPFSKTRMRSRRRCRSLISQSTMRIFSMGCLD
uniref:Uncharacterized protein MANES_12G058900 n=1 Tax=Rhizophora mucronata TaxID=61149 RepID=A0A2P2L960_RHIMU